MDPLPAFLPSFLREGRWAAHLSTSWVLLSIRLIIRQGLPEWSRPGRPAAITVLRIYISSVQTSRPAAGRALAAGRRPPLLMMQETLLLLLPRQRQAEEPAVDPAAPRLGLHHGSASLGSLLLSVSGLRQVETGGAEPPLQPGEMPRSRRIGAPRSFLSSFAAIHLFVPRLVAPPPPVAESARLNFPRAIQEGSAVFN